MKRQLIQVLFTLTVSIVVAGCSEQGKLYVDDINKARKLLDQQRSRALEEVSRDATPKNIQKLVTLGLWDKAASYLEGLREQTLRSKLVEARLLIKKHHYAEAERIVSVILADHPNNRSAKLLQAKLHIAAWQLKSADQIAVSLLQADPEDSRAGLIRGKIALLKRDYKGALNWAQKLQELDADFAGGYWLESEAHFWGQDSKKAEKPLRKALSIDPFDADARFSYGYAIWRRVDATQLDDMAGQWNLALEVNPLHYLTHWHFGNGHTNLIYADYAQPSDSVVQRLLDEGESLIAKDQPQKAIALTRSVEKEYPTSILPKMMRGSIYFMAYNMDREVRLDSAQAIFKSILAQKKNYGPAHNGLAAVIKQRQFEQLKEFESLEEELKDPPQSSVFYEVFPDADYYPGDRVTKMIAQQIGPSKAYLPMINKFGSDFAIPPLHIDLAEAMDNSYFRYGTTFDNRQWMDIRGVGSGATGIEYLERGAHQERNVLAHEYAHLYHGRILTDREDRRIRTLYHNAMREGNTLDYYAANNESEFFAQGYAGFLSERKVHPLNHKSMNTREYIKQKDPDFYTFLDSLLDKQRRYLAGDETVFDDNWAQTYLSLARQSNNLTVAAAHLDTALSYNSDYLPALLEYAKIESQQGKFDQAARRIARAKELDAEYAPIYVAEADIEHQRALTGNISFSKSIARQDSLFGKTDKMENDLAERANLNRIQRNRYVLYGKTAQALKTAKKYAEDGPTISTYLRDRRERAEAEYYMMRSDIGYNIEAINFFESLITQNPQNFTYRLMYTDVLINAKKWRRAESIIEEGQRILESADNERADYKLRRVHIYIQNGKDEKAEQLLDRVDLSNLKIQNQFLKAELLTRLGFIDEALNITETVTVRLPAEEALHHYIKALVAVERDDYDIAERELKRTLSKTPYHLKARVQLIGIFEQQGRDEELSNLIGEAKSLPVPLGPGFMETI